MSRLEGIDNEVAAMHRGGKCSATLDVLDTRFSWTWSDILRAGELSVASCDSFCLFVLPCWEIRVSVTDDESSFNFLVIGYAVDCGGESGFVETEKRPSFVEMSFDLVGDSGDRASGGGLELSSKSNGFSGVRSFATFLVVGGECSTAFCGTSLDVLLRTRE